jgi:pilus assembly protein Flp/PilA
MRIASDAIGVGTTQMKTFWKQFLSDTRGQDLVEYALAAGLVAVAAVAAMPSLSTTVSNVFAKIGSIINSSVT